MKTKLIIYPTLMVALIFSSCSSKSENEVKDKPVAVTTYTPTLLHDGGMFISGMVSAKQTAVISTRMMGYVDQIKVKQGDKVKEGQLLLVINSDDLNAKKAQAKAMVSEAEAAAKNAERDYNRFKQLHAQKSVSDKELENMELNNISIQSKLQMARQGLNEVNAMLAYTHIRAPFSGTITGKMIDEGSMANPGMPLLTMEQTGDMEVKASVPENYISSIKVGDVVTIGIKSLNKNISGKISEISPSSAMTGGQYGIRIAIDQEAKDNLHAGMYAGIQIAGKYDKESPKEIWVESSSIVKRDQLTGLYIVTPDQEAMLRWVRLGKKNGDLVEVISGLNENEQIIRLNGTKLYNGIKVLVTK